MKHYSKLKSAAVVFICITFFATHSNAQTHTWINALGGLFNDNGNWDIGVPGSNGQALFNRVGTYGVALNSDVQIGSLFVAGGNVAFVGGNLLKLDQEGSFRGGSVRFLDPGTELQADRIFIGGGGVTPVVQVESNATVFANTNFNIAVSDSWSGTARVVGNGAQLTVGDNLNVGLEGAGSLSIEGGGNVNASLVSIGLNSDASGDVNVVDEGSELNTDSLLVGIDLLGFPSGVGELTLQSGGDVVVGDNSPSTNTGSNLYVSNLGTASTMLVGNGSTINNDGGAYIGYNDNAFGEVTIDDSRHRNGQRGWLSLV